MLQELLISENLQKQPRISIYVSKTAQISRSVYIFDSDVGDGGGDGGGEDGYGGMMIVAKVWVA